MAYVPNSGSVVSYQILPSSLLSGASIFGQLPAGTAPLGSVATLQGTNPWITAQSGSVATVIIGGSVATATTNSSVMLLNGANAIGSVTTLQGTNPWITNINHSVATVIIGGSVATATTNSSVMLLNGANAIGSVTALQGTNPWITTFSNSSVFALPVGSFITLNQGSSILSVSVGSTITVLQSPSIVGTYAEDAAHTTADKGLFTLAVRNDSIASFVSADLEYAPYAVDSAGRVIAKPFSPDESTWTYQGSVVSGSVTLMKASAIGKRAYITDFWLVNSGSVATLITWLDGSTSVLGYAVAPAGTGANSPGINIPIKTNPSQDLAFKQAPSASILYVTATGYQAP